MRKVPSQSVFTFGHEVAKLHRETHGRSRATTDRAPCGQNSVSAARFSTKVKAPLVERILVAKLMKECSPN